MLGCMLLLSLPGNIAALHSLTIGKASYVKKRSRIIFLFITLADCLVTLFPIAGQLVWEAGLQPSKTGKLLIRSPPIFNYRSKL